MSTVECVNYRTNTSTTNTRAPDRRRRAHRDTFYSTTTEAVGRARTLCALCCVSARCSVACVTSGRGAGLREPNLRKLHVFVSYPARSHLRPGEAPSAQIGPASDLEMVTPEVTGYAASQNVVALKSRPDHQVDADGKRR